MKRLTRPKDEYPCRIANCREIEHWIENMGGNYENMCENCPIQPIVNKLAEYEDKDYE
jgi:hypothetical protein